MSDTRLHRQRAIADILRTEPVSNQEEVTERLLSRGFAATQATVSRDLEQLGAVKVKRGGQLGYALPDQLAESDWSNERIQRVLAEWVVSVEAAGNLVVIRTPPGSAHLVGAALDGARLPDIAGTIAGDDTLFLAIRNDVNLDAVVQRLQGLAQ
jgi:transcriptional regulator of arginine metabolism